MRPINFDRFSRALLVVAIVLAVYFTFNYLSSVLVPFIVAGVVAYMLNPVVNFFQHTCRLRFRLPCVLLTLVLFVGFIIGLLWLCIPPMFDECTHLADVARHYFQTGGSNAGNAPQILKRFFDENFSSSDIYQHVERGNYIAMIKSIAPRLWDVICSTADMLIGFVASLISLLYLFFLMLDYERYATGWTDYVPERYRRQARTFFDDVSHYVCGYFRGQVIIALSNCVMFTLGFLIVGFPMPVALGCFIGIISFVPYLQVVGILPAALLALLRSAEYGENFWLLMGSVLLVYIVVQILQDTVVTPHVMGKIMGLSPAIILLALSIGAFIGGIGGLIVALPITTIALTYYKRYVVKTE